MRKKNPKNGWLPEYDDFVEYDDLAECDDLIVCVPPQLWSAITPVECEEFMEHDEF